MPAHDAFISYSHSADPGLAAAVESGLEKLAKPALKLRAMDVFRDQTSLSANPGLWSGIVEHLQASRWFLLFASPGSAASFWCEKEILWWLENRGADQLLIVLTSGEIAWDRDNRDFDWEKTTALSRALKGRLPEEPLFVDLRWAHGHDRLTLSDSHFRSAVLDLAAPIRGIAKDQLDGDDVRQLRRNRLLARGAIAAIVMAALAAVWQAIEAVRERDLALSRQLAVQSDNLRVREPALSLLLAAQSFAAAKSTEASTALVRALKAAPLEKMIERDEPFWSLAVSADGRSAVLGGGAAATHLVDLTSGVSTPVFPPQPATLSRATLATAISADGRRVASGGFDQTISLWSAGENVIKFAPGTEAHEGFVLGLAFSPDATALASAGSDGRVLLHDLATKKNVALKKSTTPEMSRVLFSPDGRQLAAGGDGGTLILYSLADHQAASFRHEISSASVEDLAFIKGGAELVCAFYDGWLALFDVQSAKLIASIDARQFRQLEAMAASRDGRQIATGHSDGSAVLWTKDGGKWQPRVLYRHSAEAKAVAFIEDTRLTTIGLDGRLFLSRPLDLPILARERWRRPQPFENAVVSPDGAPVPAASARHEPSGNQTVAAHPDGRVLKRSNGAMSIESSGKSSAVALPELDAKKLSLAVFSPDGRILYTLAAGDLAAWASKTGKGRGKIHLETGLFPQLSISPGGGLVAVVLGNKIDFGAGGRRAKTERLVLFDSSLKLAADNLESIGNLENAFQEKPLFSPDGALLALNTSAGINFWNLDKIERIDEALPLLPGHQIVGFDRQDRRILIAVPVQGRMLELDTFPADWAGEACRIAGRALTPHEWRRYVSRELSFAPACAGGRFAPNSSLGVNLKTALARGQERLKRTLSLG